LCGEGRDRKEIPWWVWAGLVVATIEPTPFGEAVAYPIAAKYIIAATAATAVATYAVLQASRNAPRPSDKFDIGRLIRQRQKSDKKFLPKPPKSPWWPPWPTPIINPEEAKTKIGKVIEAVIKLIYNTEKFIQRITGS